MDTIRIGELMNSKKKGMAEPGLRVAWSSCYAHPLPEGHRFPMEKYVLVPEQLIHEGTLSGENLFEPAPMNDEDLLRCHSEDYVQRLSKGKLSRQEIRRTGFPWSPELVHRERVIMQGTLDAARYAMQYGIGMNVSGGTHHAFAGHGEGFCLFNDIALAARALLHSGEVNRVLVADLDVHQGNGTASLLREEPRAFTFSMHCEANYPMVKEESDLDVALPKGSGDETFLNALARHLPGLLDREKPDLLFFLSGVDVLASDKLGHLSMSIPGCRERDRMVLQWARDRSIPVCVSMGGGYSAEIRHIVEAHCNTFRMAQRIFF